MLPCSDWIAHLVRMSGKSVTASASSTAHACMACWPTKGRPRSVRTALRAPSHPTTYLARTDRSVPSRSPPAWRIMTRTGYSLPSVTFSPMYS